MKKSFKSEQISKLPEDQILRSHDRAAELEQAADQGQAPALLTFGPGNALTFGLKLWGLSCLTAQIFLEQPGLQNTMIRGLDEGDDGGACGDGRGTGGAVSWWRVSQQLLLKLETQLLSSSLLVCLKAECASDRDGF